jgi:hypothetical protein
LLQDRTLHCEPEDRTQDCQSQDCDACSNVCVCVDLFVPRLKHTSALKVTLWEYEGYPPPQFTIVLEPTLSCRSILPIAIFVEVNRIFPVGVPALQMDVTPLPMG